MMLLGPSGATLCRLLLEGHVNLRLRRQTRHKHLSVKWENEYGLPGPALLSCEPSSHAEVRIRDPALTSPP